MAKTNPLIMLVLGLAAVLILLVIISWQDYLPYDNKKQNYAKYEPFADEDEDEDEDKNKENEKIESLQTSSPSSPKPTLNSSVSAFQNVMSNVMPSPSTENFEPIVEQPQTVQYGPFRDSELIDKFSQVTANGQDGVDGCVSSGLSNSGGYICLTPELIQLLKTRGGNATGGELPNK